jgi:hypothetical protein
MLAGWFRKKWSPTREPASLDVQTQRVQSLNTTFASHHTFRSELKTTPVRAKSSYRNHSISPR